MAVVGLMIDVRCQISSAGAYCTMVQSGPSAQRMEIKCLCPCLTRYQLSCSPFLPRDKHPRRQPLRLCRPSQPFRRARPNRVLGARSFNRLKPRLRVLATYWLLLATLPRAIFFVSALAVLLLPPPSACSCTRQPSPSGPSFATLRYAYPTTTTPPASRERRALQSRTLADLSLFALGSRLSRCLLVQPPSHVLCSQQLSVYDSSPKSQASFIHHSCSSITLSCHLVILRPWFASDACCWRLYTNCGALFSTNHPSIHHDGQHYVSVCPLLAFVRLQPVGALLAN